MLQIILYGLVFVAGVAVTAKVRSARWRTIVLLAGSYAVYLSWSWWFIGLLVLSTVVNFLLGRRLREHESGGVLALGVVFNLALLASFKYVPPIALTLPFTSLHQFANLALPLGMSFWTFQAMSYLFDQYRGEDLDPTLAEFALYMAFFPVTISGPICRVPDMLPQFRSKARTSWIEIGAGLQRIAIGVLMMLLARVLGQGVLSGDGVNGGFDHMPRWSGLDVWFLAFGFGLQLFFDFAGYSHIAIGAAKAMGFTLPENFARPFASTTPSIFWTRWHMSLSFWIRDYLFLPLAVVRREVWWRNAMLVVAMVAFGIWHKATWLFVIWGAYHGVLLVTHRVIQAAERRFEWEPPEPISSVLSWFVTIATVSLGWIFFRANSLIQVREMMAAVLSPESYTSRYLSVSFYGLVMTLAAGYAMVSLMGAALERQSSPEKRTTMMARVADLRWYWIPPLYALALLFVLMITLTKDGGAAQLMYRGF